MLYDMYAILFLAEIFNNLPNLTAFSVYEKLMALPLPKQNLTSNDVPNLLFKLFNLGFVAMKDLAHECSWVTGLAEKLDTQPLVAMAVVLSSLMEKHPNAEEALKKVSLIFYPIT